MGGKREQKKLRGKIKKKMIQVSPQPKFLQQYNSVGFFLRGVAKGERKDAPLWGCVQVFRVEELFPFMRVMGRCGRGGE